MKTLKKVLVALLVIIVVAALGGGVFVRQVARKALPDYNRSVFLDGMREEVRIYRDKNAVPHLYASHEHDLYMAVGYVMAQDRLWQMDLLRRVTMGRLSEIFGDRMLGADQLFRALRIPEKSAMVMAQSSPEILAALAAFSSGVNQFIDQHEKKLPFEFTLLGYKPEKWESMHSYNLIGYMAWDLSGSWGPEAILHKLRNHLSESLFQELVPDLDYHTIPVYPRSEATSGNGMLSLLGHAQSIRDLGLEVFSGSNSWAVSPAKTTTGFPLFANDMHLSFGAPGIWYQIHQVVEGQLHVAGVALPGQPLVIVGHNEHIAWGMTNLYVDDIDFYVETLNPDNPNQYLLDGAWRDFEVRDELILTSQGDTVVRTNRFNHRGPVISDFRGLEDQVVTMRWIGNSYSDEVRSIYLVNRANDWESFRDAMSTMISVSQNVTYADVYGNIGQQTVGGVPVRNSESGAFFFPGDMSSSDWTGLVPFDDLPREFNPPSGYVSSANNRTVGDEYPHYIGIWFDTPNRIGRIREMLESQAVVDASYFKTMLGDAQSNLAHRVSGALTDVLLKAQDLSANETAALEAWKSWDYVMDMESTAATIFEQFYHTFMWHVLADEMGEDLYKQFGGSLIRNMFDQLIRNPESAWFNDVNTPENEGFDDMVIRSFRATIAKLELDMGMDAANWQWGRVHQLRISHPLASEKILDRIFNLSRGPYPLHGSFHTIANYAYSFQHLFAVVHGASQRHIFNPGDWADNHMIIPTGASGIPASRYYLNQLDTFVSNAYFRQAWNREDVEAEARYVSILAPAR